MCYKFLFAPVFLLASVSGAPYDVQETPERLVKPHVSSVQCGVEYVTIWDTEYVEKPYQTCETVYEQVCQVESERLCQNTTREQCHLVQDQVCNTQYHKVCRDEYKTVLEPYTETECVTLYKDDCEYHWEVVGGEKIWAVIPGTCKKHPYDECHDVQKTHSKQVSYQVCDQVPQEKCHYVNKQECYQVPDQVCRSQPITKCQEVPKEICHVHHKRVPVRVSKKVPKKVCNVPGHVDNVHEFVPVPAVPVLPPATVTTTAPDTLDDILNREVDQQFSDKFVFEDEPVADNKNNSTIKFTN